MIKKKKKGERRRKPPHGVEAIRGQRKRRRGRTEKKNKRVD